MSQKDEITEIKIDLAEIKAKQDAADRLLSSVDTKMDSLLQSVIPALHTELGMLKIRSSLWGVIAGSVPGIAVAIYLLLS